MQNNMSIIKCIYSYSINKIYFNNKDHILGKELVEVLISQIY